ncbi:MAG TPA: DUF4294 domain-containing protein [Lacibacter sp.]|nr:DUF4294 domain-containing protein [Lacibacter sp.]
MRPVCIILSALLSLLLQLAGATCLQAQELPLPPEDRPTPGTYRVPGYGPYDTIYIPAIVYNGELLGARQLAEIFIWGGDPRQYEKQRAEWTRLRNAVYVTYPYAYAAGEVMNDVLRQLAGVKNKSERKKYIKSREKELRAAFGDQISELSVYQGKVLMKLINRQTGNDCYEIIREMKGGVTARLYQTILFFVGSDLRQDWQPQTEKRDRQIEGIVQEISRMYYPYSVVPATQLQR